MSVERALRAEIESLRSAIEALRLRVESQEERIAELAGREPIGFEGERSSIAAASEDSATRGSYSVVSSSAGRGTVATEDTEGRVALAKEIGDFVVRSLDGQHRGSSGRSRLNLASRLYVIFADFEGVRFAPPRVVRTFAEASALCKRGASCGAAIFVGFPSQWEARIAVERTGLVWPNPVL